jgi:hydrogenase maturation protein HypF
MAHLQTFPLPGGEKAIKEPKRIAIALLYRVFGEQIFLETLEFADLPCITAFTRQELAILRKMLRQNINTPLTSSMGRLFDGVAAILGIRQYITYEGQAAIELEYAMGDFVTDAAYKLNLIPPSSKAIDSPLIINWREMIEEILLDIKNQVSRTEIVTKFHNTMIEIIVAVAQQSDRSQIILTGGCFQNKYLTEKAIARLQQANFTPYWHHHIPCNDGGIAVGQILAAVDSSAE